MYFKVNFYYYDLFTTVLSASPKKEIRSEYDVKKDLKYDPPRSSEKQPHVTGKNSHIIN